MRFLLLFCYGAILAGAAGIAYGTWSVFEQHRRITTAQPIDATVLDGWVEKKKVDVIPMFTPRIEYEYTVGGRRYVSDTTMPTEVLGWKGWADAIVKEYAVGKKVQAHIDPDDPTDSFLISKYGSEPYLTVLYSFVFACMAIVASGEFKPQNHEPPNSPPRLGPTPLVEKNDHRQEERLMGTIGATGLAIGVSFCTHFFLVSTPPFDWLFWILVICYHLVGLWAIGWALYSHWRKGGFGITTIEIDAAPPEMGRELRVRLSQPIHFVGTIRRLALELSVRRKKPFFDITPDANKPAPVLYLQRAVLLENYEVLGDEVLERSAGFTLPAFLPLDDQWNTQPHVWTLELRGEANRWRTLHRDYILNVVSPEDGPDYE